MPTNLKSLLSRSRSRNELKSREKGEDITSESESNGANNGCGSNTDVVNGNCGINGGTSSGCSSNGQFRCCAIPGDESGFRGCCNPSVSNGMKSDPNYSNLFLSCSTLNHSSPGTTDSSSSTTTTGATSTVYTNGTTTSTKNANSRCGSPFATCSTVQQEDFSPRQSLAMRKCETVLALSSFTGSQTTSSPTTNSTSPFNSVGSASASTTTSASGPSGKVKVMKDKIFSTSSSTLNCLLHSTNRSKLFSGWKLSSTSTNGHNNSNSSGSSTTATQMYPGFFIDDVSVTRGSSVTNDNALTIADVQQISKSQLSIPETNVPLTPLNRLRRNISINNAYFSLGANSSYSRSSSMASFGWREKEDFNELDILCRLCLCNVKMDETVEILACACRYCKDCVMAYVSFEIQEGAEEIACPDATCEKQGVLTLPEIESLMPSSMVEKHKKFRLYREVEKDGHLMWCPSPGCETVCRIQETIVPPPLDGKVSKPRSSSIHKSLIINCGTCRKSFCAECKLSWHPGTSCEAFRRKLVKQGKLSLDDEELFSLESIKKCPFCHVPIEKDSGCAQMMCKRCKHVFCWYCLASLDDDFLLRHYDKGPCKNKLGHSRASVVWHRAQVIGIFAGFGVLVLLASPLLILAAPCLLCCRCRYCANKTETEESPVPV